MNLEHNEPSLSPSRSVIAVVSSSWSSSIRCELLTKNPIGEGVDKVVLVGREILLLSEASGGKLDK